MSDLSSWYEKFNNNTEDDEENSVTVKMTTSSETLNDEVAIARIHFLLKGMKSNFEAAMIMTGDEFDRIDLREKETIKKFLTQANTKVAELLNYL